MTTQIKIPKEELTDLVLLQKHIVDTFLECVETMQSCYDCVEATSTLTDIELKTLRESIRNDIKVTNTILELQFIKAKKVVEKYELEK